MKITLTKNEAANLLGPIMTEKFYPSSVNVEIADAVSGSIPPYIPPSVQDRLPDLTRAFQRNVGSYHNKIAMIKEIRTLTGWGLKDSKDFVETILSALGV